jgi:hypothetical protein
VQREKPDNVNFSVPYKGYWFYIAENDISSKRTMGVLNSLDMIRVSNFKRKEFDKLMMGIEMGTS